MYQVHQNRLIFNSTTKTRAQIVNQIIIPKTEVPKLKAALMVVIYENTNHAAPCVVPPFRLASHKSIIDINKVWKMRNNKFSKLHNLPWHLRGNYREVAPCSRHIRRLCVPSVRALLRN